MDTAEYGTKARLNKKAKVTFTDGMSATLRSFSHKRPMKGGPTKATSYIDVTKEELTSTLNLSIHGIQGKSKEEDGLTDEMRYDTMDWQGYRFQLKDFSYDSYIDVVVSKL
ncbi:hypothetical protein M0813_20171 [Anaeramoeba flamelloides]|uniref:Uncharacterized protein n=1 Tax=Anaeramoeba flamelloides TaxID=1746091 RepID=A0AAV7YIY3_9EUKA|nr:hypothetical protein M0812_25167 [Anaeramoeba flamelloides]KAJ6245751.1 hypothetical protein M0813_20171 [Anaeramoeba flamelloides]